jgi:hypothetical protein
MHGLLIQYLGGKSYISIHRLHITYIQSHSVHLSYLVRGDGDVDKSSCTQPDMFCTQPSIYKIVSFVKQFITWVPPWNAVDLINDANVLFGTYDSVFVSVCRYS